MSLLGIFQFYCVSDNNVHGTVIDEFLTEKINNGYPRYVEIMREMFYGYFQDLGVPSITYKDQTHILDIHMDVSARHSIEFEDDIFECYYYSGVKQSPLLSNEQHRFDFDIVNVFKY
jgi:hypothetical protein